MIMGRFSVLVTIALVNQLFYHKNILISEKRPLELFHAKYINFAIFR